MIGEFRSNLVHIGAVLNLLPPSGNGITFEGETDLLTFEVETEIITFEIL
jgi:hypothetical protein